MIPPISSHTINYTEPSYISRSRHYTPEDYLIETLGGVDNSNNRKWAKELLAKYDFPKNSIHNPLEFSIHYLAWGQIPQWAEQYKIPPTNIGAMDEHMNFYPLSYFSNLLIKSGVDGDVYQDDDENYVVKKYHEKYNNLDEDEIESIKKSTSFFCNYYGENTSKIYYDDDNNLYIKMKKITGQPLSDVNSFTENAIEKFNIMLTDIADKNIYHSDLHKNNILWDSAEKKFNPIDFGDDPNDYSSILDKEDILERMQYELEDCIYLIKSKIKNNLEDSNLSQAMLFESLV